MNIKETPDHGRSVTLNAEEKEVLCKAIEYAKIHLDDLDIIDFLEEQGFEPEGLVDDDDDSIEPWYPPLDQLIIKIQSMLDVQDTPVDYTEFSLLSLTAKEVPNHFALRPDKDQTQEFSIPDCVALEKIRETINSDIRDRARKTNPELFVSPT